MHPKIVFFLASISQPRCIKRIKSFVKAGFSVEVYGLDRGVYNVNAVIPDVHIEILGSVPSGRDYFSKFLFIRKKLLPIFKKHRKEEVIYYAFSFDLALLCKIYSDKKFCYEISDLVYGYFNIVLRKAFVIIDKWLISHSFLTVFTSQGFKNYLFRTKLLNHVIIQPNKVDSELSSLIKNETPRKTRELVFTFAGAFRYPNTIFRFANIIGKSYPSFSFRFYGDSNLTNRVKEISERYKNVDYYGAYKSPEDLPEIYKSTDIIVACYDTKKLNERVAEPNKLYEALFFAKPIIVSEGTFLAERVNHFDCGFSIDAHTDFSIIEFLDSLDEKTVQQKIDNIKKVDLKEIVDDDGEAIISYLRKNL